MIDRMLTAPPGLEQTRDDLEHPATAEERADVRLVDVLIADDDPQARALVAGRLRAAACRLRVLEADDGAEALQIGLQRSPQIALLDVNMPRLGGIDVAFTLRELRPSMRLALYTAAPQANAARARSLELALFDKLAPERVVEWVETQAREYAAGTAGSAPALDFAPRADLRCARCGYGIVSRVPPQRCPMCQALNSWEHAPWRPFTARP